MALHDLGKAECQLEIVKLLESVDSHMRQVIVEQWRAKQSDERDAMRYVDRFLSRIMSIG